MENGAKPNDAAGIDYPIVWAAYHNRLDCAQLLIEWGASVDVCNRSVDGSAGPEYPRVPPLVLAARRGHIEMVKLLLASSGNLNAHQQLRLALKWAKHFGHFDCVALLERRVAKVGN